MRNFGKNEIVKSMKLNGESSSKNKFIGLIKFLLLQTYLIK